MEDAMKALLLVVTTLASMALGLVSAWILLKIVLTLLTRGSAFEAKARTPFETEHLRG